jgi:signal peptide peptidase SppA
MLEEVIDISGINAPHMNQFMGIWAMREEDFQGALQAVSLMNLQVHVQQNMAAGTLQASNTDPRRYTIKDGIATFLIHGPMTKYLSSMQDGTSTVAMRKMIRQASNDQDVAAILTVFDTPGGSVAGTFDLAQEMADAKKKKPVYAYCEDLCASAGYWVASQATKVFAGTMSLVGSIGTYGVIYDYSGMAAQKGIKAIVVRAGEFKGAGIEGTEITPEQRQEFQRTVNDLNEHFLKGVASGRGMSQKAVREIADGRVHIADQAKSLGLIDEVGSFQDVWSALSGKVSKKGTMKMDDTIVTPKAATYSEIKAACVGADPAFIGSQCDANATIGQAQSAWMAEQNKRLAAAQAETETEKAKAAKPGVEPVSAKKATRKDGDVSENDDFAALVAVKMNAGMTRIEAVKRVARENPEAHNAWLAEKNDCDVETVAFVRTPKTKK